MAAGDQYLQTIRNASPQLTAQVDELAAGWLSLLLGDPSARGPEQDKHFNDPVWGTITLHPWEVALLDTPLVQRLRGVKQLGLAHLVFPTATHDRFSHACGVVEAAERMMDQIVRNTKARRRTGRSEDAPPDIQEHERYLIRLAALIHDVGHGPFSHAIEPVVERIFASEINGLKAALRAEDPRIDKVQVSEAVAVLTVASPAFQELLSRPLMNRVLESKSAADVTKGLIAAIVGGSDGSACGALGALVSSQVDADKLDYMARDAHHAGLPIDFDTERLISKLEALRVEEGVLSPRLHDLKERIRTYPDKRYQEIGISAGGTGAFEQMLVGRIFLYDRLYHHHKVRAADAMAQRLVYYADPERKQLSLAILYASLSDDMVIHAFGGLPINVGTVERPIRFPTTQASKEISDAILQRALYKRAFAFAGRFIAGLDTDVMPIPESGEPSSALDEEEKDAERSRVMERVNRELADLEERLKAEEEIAALAWKIGSTLGAAHELGKQSEGLAAHHVIVDLPRKAHPNRITTIARGDDGRLDVPDVFYDPARWANVYATQRRTGYVFAHPARRAIICLASRVWFLRKFKCVLGETADRQAKAGRLIKAPWYGELETAGLITARERSYLEKPRLVHLPLELRNNHVPKEWLEGDPTFIRTFNDAFNNVLPDGISALAESELVQALRGIFRTIQTWSMDSTFVTSPIESEKVLQEKLRQALRQRELDIGEGEEQAGGETDIKIGRRVILENKSIKGKTDDPFQAVSRSGLQGRRYVLPTGQSFIITAVSYEAASESGKLKPSECVQVRQLEGVDQPFVEIRIAIRHSDSLPSRAK